MAHQGDNTMDSTDTHHSHTGKTGNYGRFFAMIGTSTIVMYGLMYLNTYALDHVFFLANSDVDGALHGRDDGGDHAGFHARHVFKP